MKQTADRAREWFEVYTRDFSAEELQRLFTHDTPDAYRFFGRTRGEDLLAGLPLEETGLELVVERHASDVPSEIARRVIKTVEHHTTRTRFHDDLTILIVKRDQSRA